MLTMAKKDKIRKLIIAGCTSLVLLNGTMTVYADPDIDDVREERDETQAELDEVNATLEELAAEQEDVEAQISEVSEALTQVMAEIEVLEGQIDDKEIEIAASQILLEEAEQRALDQYEAMKIRIRYMYEEGESNYTAMLMQAESYADMLTKADYIEKLYEYDRDMLAQYQETVQEVADRKAVLEEEREELLGLEKDHEEEQQYMEGVIAELKEVSDDFAAEIRTAQAQAAEYAKQIRAQNAEIKRLEEEARRKAEEEARRRAEEEARRKAEEEAKRLAEELARKQAEEEARRLAEEQARKQAEEDRKQIEEEARRQVEEDEKKASEAARESAESSVAESRETGTITTTGSATYDISSIYAANGGDTGKSIAAFACKFIGNPYVAGGTSLTNGADCSGFVFSVYKEFGYKVPRTSYALRSAGKEVSGIDSAQPGDVICYPGHVGIYIGNGMIVHASTERSGIKVSRANYREYVAIRRII
ncbi:MAG: C40 family peptidase [Lachnospiraceae bacterium]|nr:C40 family peptidase [Lachnospiraceae bacterium]